VPWVSRLLRGERVYVKVGPGGAPATGSDGRVDIVYKPGGKVYRAGARNLLPDPSPQTLPDSEVAPAPGVPPMKDKASVPNDAIIVYTDGACSGNPGPAGLGVVILDGGKRRELSEYLGTGTNNIAELMAIVRALEEVPRDRTIVLHSDSSYSLGLLGKGWKAKANQELVGRLRKRVAAVPNLEFVKVPGHAGVPENERCDELARDAITGRAR